MRFTVIFGASETSDHSYGLTFQPNPVWVRGTQQIAVITRDPWYVRGGVRLLLEHEKLTFDGDDRRAAIVVRQGGCGTIEDFRTLEADLAEEGFGTLALDAAGRDTLKRLEKAIIEMEDVQQTFRELAVSLATGEAKAAACPTESVAHREQIAELQVLFGQLDEERRRMWLGQVHAFCE